MASRELPPGLYDDLVTVALERLIGGLDASSRAQLAELADGDAPARLSRHVADAVAMVLDALGDEGRTDAGSALVHDLLAVLAHHAPEAVPDLHLPQPTRTLTVVEPRLPDGSYRTIERPLTSLHDTTLLVNAPGEPTILHELIGEIPSAHRIDVLMAFVRATLPRARLLFVAHRGESEVQRWIIENGWLEAVVALPNSSSTTPASPATSGSSPSAKARTASSR